MLMFVLGLHCSIFKQLESIMCSVVFQIMNVKETEVL